MPFVAVLSTFQQVFCGKLKVAMVSFSFFGKLNKTSQNFVLHAVRMLSSKRDIKEMNK